MPEEAVPHSWLATLRQHVESKPCVRLRLDESDSGNLTESRRGFNEFTLARPHELLSDIKTPTACLIFSSPPALRNPGDAHPNAYPGIVSSRSAITTLDTRIKIRRAVRIEPGTVDGLMTLLGTGAQANCYKKTRVDRPRCHALTQAQQFAHGIDGYHPGQSRPHAGRCRVALRSSALCQFLRPAGGGEPLQLSLDQSEFPFWYGNLCS